MNPSNAFLVTVMTAFGMASAAFAAPVGRVNQCPQGWGKAAASCPERRAPNGGMTAAYRDVEQPRRLTRAEVRAELDGIRRHDQEQLAAAAQRPRTGD